MKSKLMVLITSLIILSSCSFLGNIVQPETNGENNSELVLSADAVTGTTQCKDAIEECILQNKVLLDENKTLTEEIENAGGDAGLLFGAGAASGAVIVISIVLLILFGL